MMKVRSLPWLLIGFASGYFTAALVAARHWGWLP